MNELERIEAMRAAGTISDAEADRLVAVLRDLEAIPGATAAPADGEEARRVARETREQARVAAREARGAARAAREARGGADELGRAALDAVQGGLERVRDALSGVALGGTGAGAASEGGPDVAPSGDLTPADVAPAATRWLRVELVAGDVELYGADDVDAPEVVAGDGVRLEATDQGARVNVDPETSLLGRFRPVDVRVRVPRAWGVDLDLKAGDLELSGVRYVRGRVLAGDVEIAEAHGIDLTCGAGDLSIGLRPTEGRHRVVARAGDLSVRLLEGSDVEVEGRLSMGDLSVRGLESERRGLGGVVRGRLGQGRAHLTLELGAGDLQIRADAKEG
ncbi:MAG: hypothetical protein P1P87_12365 [Trueperaceae bacterium]|nr:hypothetical protein [Trueperaceae bacterium]